MSDEPAKPISDRLGLALLVVVLAFIGWRLLRVGGTTPPVPNGTPLPALTAEGWLNVPDGKAFDPAGELVVVDCWATWCGPCLADLPNMTTIASDYRPRGVKFLSITQETAADLPAIEAVIKRTPGFNWPIAYGGFQVLNALDIHSIPTVILFGRDGKVRWSGIGSYGLAGALDKALAEEPAASSENPPAPAAATPSA
jgi:thiol-disulfide isomerase/thioredoxin